MEDFRKLTMTDADKQKILTRVNKLEEEIINLYTLVNKYLEENIYLNNKILALEEKLSFSESSNTVKTTPKTISEHVIETKEVSPGISEAHNTISQPKAKATSFMNLKDKFPNIETLSQKIPEIETYEPLPEAVSKEQPKTESTKQDIPPKKALPEKRDIKPPVTSPQEKPSITSSSQNKSQYTPSHNDLSQEAISKEPPKIDVQEHDITPGKTLPEKRDIKPPVTSSQKKLSVTSSPENQPQHTPSQKPLILAPSQKQVSVIPSQKQPEKIMDSEKKNNIIITPKTFNEPKITNLVLINGGSFYMGTDSEDAFGYEKPAHKVELNYSFYAQKYLVTQEFWKEIIDDLTTRFIGDKLPVESVTWFEAIMFCNFLSSKENYPIAYHDTSGELLDADGRATKDVKKVVGYRLPTEAEWEYLARGGNKSRGYKYSGSNNPDEVAWYYDNSENMTHPVGEKLPNELGLFDLNGNVWEWCTDSYERYQPETILNPYIFSGETSNRVLRGGSWDYQDGTVTVTARGFSSPVINDSGIGFRIFKTANF